MALEGTLRDFSLADILQLISLQKKTGLLSLQSALDQVTLGFVEGKLVSAESAAKRMDNRLGTVLVKTRRLKRDDLQKALEIQGQTLQRLGFILLRNGFCSAEDLRDGLDIQIRKIAYGLFRWTDGGYVFDQQEHIDYDHDFVTPIAVESLLMEGARMIDEWPIIEKVVRSVELVYKKVPVGQPVIPAEEDEEVEEPGETTLERKAREKRDDPIKISRAEWAVYELIDGNRTVADINERTFLSEFDGCKAVFDLVSRGLVVEARPVAKVLDLAQSGSIEIPAPGRRRTSSGGWWLLAIPVVLAGFIVAIRQEPRNALNVLTIPPRRLAVVDGFDKANSLMKLRRLSEAVDSFYLTSGRFPESTDALVIGGLLAQADLSDPWGRRYRYILQKDKYYLVGFDPDGKTDIDLFFSHNVIKQAKSSPNGSTRSNSGKEVIVIK